MKLFKKIIAYVLENGRKRTVKTYTVLKETTKESIIECLKKDGIKYDGIDSIYPAI